MRHHKYDDDVNDGFVDKDMVTIIIHLASHITYHFLESSQLLLEEQQHKLCPPPAWLQTKMNTRETKSGSKWSGRSRLTSLFNQMIFSNSCQILFSHLLSKGVFQIHHPGRYCAKLSFSVQIHFKLITLMSSSVLVGLCEHSRQSIQNLSFSDWWPLLIILIVIIIIMTNPPHRPIICCHQYHFQSWLDIVRTINRDSALYGIGVAPLELDPLLPEPINIDQEMVGYQVTVSSFFLLTQCKKTKIKILSSGETKHVECHGSWHPGYRTWQVHIYDLIVCPFIFHIWFWWMY